MEQDLASSSVRPYPELSVIGIALGAVQGVLMTDAFVYIALMLGFGLAGSTVAAIIGFTVLRGAMRRKSILENNIAQSVRDHFDAEKRSLRKEEKKLDESRKNGLRFRDTVPANQSSPSQKAMKSESRRSIEEALSELPADQGEAVRLRHLEGWSLKQLAQHFDRSEVAVAGLLKRGMKALRDIVREGEGLS